MATEAQARPRSLLARLGPELLPAVVAGLVNGALDVTIAIAFGALIFAGDLSVHLPAAIGLMLVGALIITMTTALTSQFPAAVSSLQDSPAAVLALVAAAIAASMGSAAGEGVFVTIIAAITLTSLLTGAFFFLLGQFKLGNLIRFIPYPVIGGFLGGTGLLLIRGAISVMTGLSVDLADLSPLVAWAALQKWLPGLIFAVLLLVILRVRSHFLIVPGMLIGAAVMFYLALLLTGTSVAEATNQGWLIQAAEGGALWKPWVFTEFSQIDWSALSGEISSMAAIAVISAIALLLNASGLELITEKTVDLNRELKTVGVANLLAGLAGSEVGFHALSTSALAYKMGARSRLTGLIVGAICGLALLAGSSLLTYIPNPLLGGLLFFLGLDLLIGWVYDAWFRLPKADYLIVVLILAVINLVGFLEGIGLGVVLAVILFVLDYSRVDVVKHTLSGATYHSNVVRPRLYQQSLRADGSWVYILRLQGFIFFGTANKLLDQVRQRLDDPDLTPPRFLVLDFRLVNGVDSSALLSFTRMIQLCRARGVLLIFCDLAPGVQREVEKAVLDKADCCVFADLDHAIEWCEDQMIQQFIAEGQVVTPKTLMEQLEESLPDLSLLMAYLDCEIVEAGFYLMHQGDAPQGLYFIEGGRVTVRLELDDGDWVRLRRMDAGTIVGELGMYLERPATASVITEQPSTLYRLSPDALRRMETSDPDIAAALHRFMARFMAERLVQTTDTLQAFVD